MLLLWFRNGHFELCSLTFISRIAFPSLLVTRGIKSSIKTSLLSLELLSGHSEICSLTVISKNSLSFFIIGSEKHQKVHQQILLLETLTKPYHHVLGMFVRVIGSEKWLERVEEFETNLLIWWFSLVLTWFLISFLNHHYFSQNLITLYSPHHFTRGWFTCSWWIWFE